MKNEGKDKQSVNYTHVKNNNMHILWLAPACALEFCVMP